MGLATARLFCGDETMNFAGRGGGDAPGRFRTLGCLSVTGAIESSSATSKGSSRNALRDNLRAQGRVIDRAEAPH